MREVDAVVHHTVPATALGSIAVEIRQCTRCQLHRSRRVAVAGEGAAPAPLLFIGEAPGEQEDKQGLPFVGRAGRTLDAALLEAQLDRAQTFVTNIVKCRPPGNRMPRSVEVHTCIENFLWRQIQCVNPRLICLLGATAAKAILGSVRLKDVRGKPLEVTIQQRAWTFLVTYHPAAAGRSKANRAALVEDLQAVQAYLRHH